MRSNEIDSTVRLANICLIHFPHSGLCPFNVDGPHRLLQANSRDAREQMAVNGIPHHLNYCVKFYSVYKYNLQTWLRAAKYKLAGRGLETHGLKQRGWSCLYHQLDAHLFYSAIHVLH
jgi:hypothetical protein